MNPVKHLLKRLLPAWLLRVVLPVYHWSRALLANLIYGFPAKRMKVIAITGTNGKTTTAAYVTSILRSAGYKVGVSTTAYFEYGKKHIVNDTNMTVTDPFKIQKLLAKMRLRRVDWVVLEVTSHALQQYRVWGIPIKAAVITNLTQDHLDYHGTMEKYAAAKAKLLKKKPAVIVINRDDEWFDYFDQIEAGEHKMSFGENEASDCRIEKSSVGRTSSQFSLVIDKSVKLDLKTKLKGIFNVYNATAAVAVTYLLHVKKSAIVDGIANVDAVPGRMEVIDEGQNFSVIVDYAHTPDALKNALSTTRGLTKNRVILVYGSCGDRDKLKRPDMGKVAVEHADRIVLTDEEPYTEDPKAIREQIKAGIDEAGGDAKCKEVPDRREAIRSALNIARRGDSVIITGMGHQSYMTVGNQKLPWDDREVTRELLRKKLKK